MIDLRHKAWELLLRRGRKRITMFNEGGSRSGKTYSILLFFLDLFHLYPNGGFKIYVYRDTLSRCKEFTLDDFKKCLSIHSISTKEIFSENSQPEYKHGNNVILFRGLDKMSDVEGGDSDFVFLNELLSGVSQKQFDNVTMRCRRMVIADWNPRFAEYWAFEYEKRPNVTFTHTTFRDNPFCPIAVRDTILSYEPTQQNIDAGTADGYKWKVYGLGERCSQEGLVFPVWYKCDNVDEQMQDQRTIYGLDFGYSADPVAIVEVCVKGRDLYLREMYYGTKTDDIDLAEIIKLRCDKDKYIVADYGSGGDARMVNLYRLTNGYKLVKATKGKGSVMGGIDLLKNYNIHIDTASENMLQEFRNYAWIEGKDMPIDKFNHTIDAIRYAVDCAIISQITN